MHLTMLNYIKSLFSPVAVAKPQSAPSVQQIQRAVDDMNNKPIYPPFDKGVAVMDLDRLISSQSETIRRINVAFSMTNETFEEVVMATIRNYAAYVHLLPATNKENHIGTSGLFKLGLDTAFYSVQAAEGKVYSNKETAERRRMMHPKWVYATFVAGLCCDLNLPITTMTITSENGDVWPATDMPLYQWALEVGTDVYFIHWRDHPSGSEQAWHTNAAYVLNMVIPKAGANYLRTDNNSIFTEMLASISSVSRHGDGNVIAESVRHYRDWLIDKDIKANPSYYGKLTVGAHLSHTVIDIMRELYKDNVWTLNSKGSRIWNTKEGCFIIWGAAFAEIIAVMSKRKVSGAPTSSETMAELLLNANMIDPQTSGSPIWEVTLPHSPRLMETIKLNDAAIIFENSELEVSEVSLLNPVPMSTPEPQSAPVPELASKKESIEGNSTVATVKPVADKPEPPVVAAAATNNKVESKDKNDAQKPQGENVKVAENKPVQANQKPAQVKPAQEAAPVSKPIQQAAVPKPVQPVVKPDAVAPKKDIQTQPNAPAINPKIIEQVSEDTRRLINAIKSDMHDGKSEFPVWMNARGLVISREEFESHGMHHIKVLDELVSNNWIVRDAENNNRVIYRTEKEGVKVSGYLINKSIALALGFKDSNA